MDDVGVRSILQEVVDHFLPEQWAVQLMTRIKGCAPVVARSIVKAMTQDVQAARYAEYDAA